MTAKEVRGVAVHATFYFPDVVLADGDTATLRMELTNELTQEAVRLLLAGESPHGYGLDSSSWVEAMELVG